MRYVHNLHVRRQRRDNLAHGIGYAARHARIDLVEYDRRQLGFLGQHGLQSQHYARCFTSRSDLLHRLRGHTSVGREHETHTVAARCQQLARRLHLNLETRLRHAQLDQHGRYARRYALRSLAPHVVYGGGTPPGIPTQSVDLLALRRQSLIAMLYET